MFLNSARIFLIGNIRIHLWDVIVFKFFLGLVIINLFLFGLGAGWFGFKPSEVEIGAHTKAPTEFRPQAIRFTNE